MGEFDLSGRVALVTGGGAGMGRAYALELAARGAAVLVNDPGTEEGTGRSSAEAVVAEISSAGGKAAANEEFLSGEMASAESIVKSAITCFGSLHIIVNNAGLLRDVTLGKQSMEDWALVQDVHLWGQRNMCKVAWGHMIGQGYGRIVNIGSTSICGRFGQSNYSAAKAGIVGLTKALALEGARRNIKVNMLLPGGGTGMSATIQKPKHVKVMRPAFAAPIVTFLCSDDERVPSGRICEAGGGYFAEWQWRRATGAMLDIRRPIEVNDISKNWANITDMSSATDPILEDEKLPKQMWQVYEAVNEATKSSKL